MKTLAWQNFFAEQRAAHGKVVFSVPELANVAQTSLHALNTELGRLVKRGVLVRYAHGRYGIFSGVTPEDILAAVDPGAYITGFYALAHHHHVTQVPSEITCFTNRRHNRKSDRLTPAGKLRFICVPPGLYDKPRGSLIAPPEQALCDFAWLSLTDGIDPRSLVTFRNLNRLSRRLSMKRLSRYPDKVRQTVALVSGLLPMI